MVTGGVYTVTLYDVTVVPGSYNVKVTLGLTYDVYQGYTSFQVVQARPAFDFSIQISPPNIVVKQGEIARYTLSVTYSDPYYKGIQIQITDVSGLGAGTTWKIETGDILAISTSESTPPKAYAFTVTGSAKGVARSVSGTLTVEALKPVLTYVSVTGIPPGGPIYTGEESTSVVVISNTGNAKAVAVKVILEDLTPAPGLTIVTSDPPRDIAPLETAQWMIKVRADRPGKYSGMLRTYVGTERVLEQAWALEVSAPEIDITNKNLSFGAGQIYAGDTFTVTYTLRNRSPVDASQLSVDITTSDGLTVLDQSTIAEIASQSEVKLILKLKAEKVGNAWVQTTVSSYGTTVKEDKTTFNISERPIWQQEWVLAAVGVGAAVVVAAVIMLRRRRPAVPTLDLTQASIPTEPSSNLCPRCGKPLTYVQAHSRWYCTKCKEYV
jgi:hypothetical protein